MSSICRKSNSIQALSERDPREKENQTNEIAQLVSDISSTPQREELEVDKQLKESHK